MDIKKTLKLHKKWLYGDRAGIRADLREADLRGVDLSYADLRSADLSEADLREANLSWANLSNADLRGAFLYCANIDEAKLPHFQICPEQGSFQAWKRLSGGVVARIEVPRDAKRTSALNGRKCRASHVRTLEFINTKERESLALYDLATVYSIGRITTADSYDDDVRIACTNGIHFFMTQKEAEEWLKA